MNSAVHVFLARVGVASLLLVLPSFPTFAQTDISPAALQQIQELIQEKQSRTAVERKLAGQLVYSIKAASGLTLTSSISSLSLPTDAGQGVLVDMRATVSPALLSAITNVGGRVIYSSSNRVRARIPVAQLQATAARPDVQFIKPAARSKLVGTLASVLRSPAVTSHIAARRAMNTGVFSLMQNMGLNFFIGGTTTQGYIAHGANTARSLYGVTGAGVRVGVLSDSAEFLPNLIASGDLPATAQNVADIIDGPGSSEGSAMMEIVYDMAPGTQIFFASAFNGPTSFADNIRLLRNTYNCDIIVDDVSYSDESPFQDGEIAQAVNQVTASGALYFSSVGNSGNLTNGNSSGWEGDFVPGGTSGPYTLHSFGGQTFNRLMTLTGVVDLFWADPAGAVTNDYDLYVLDAAGTTVLAASTDDNSASGSPFEEVYSPAGFPANSRVVIAALSTAAPRALHLDLFFGEPLQIKTAGVTRGHNSGLKTVSVAAVAWNSARLGTRPFTGGVANPTEVFSSDGPRRIFFQPDGTPITAGNFLYGTNGGSLLIKPDIAAADGVSTRTPGFSPFYGTSAAAPHAAGVAALIKSAKPSLTNVQIRNAMTSTALDIRAPGVDRDSGYGITMAPSAIAAALQ